MGPSSQCGCAHKALQELGEVADMGRSLCCDRAQCEAEGQCAKQLPTHGPSLSTPWAALAEPKMSEWSLLVLQGLHCPSIMCAHGMCALWWGQALRRRDLSSTAGHCPALGHSRSLETPLQPNPASPTVASEGCLEPPIKVFLSPAISRGCCVG